MGTNNDVLDWLLAGPPWLKFAVETQLLDADSDIEPVLRDSSIQKIIHRLKDGPQGFSALGTNRTSYTDTGNMFWDLFFLADIGLKASDVGLEKDIERVFSYQHPSGALTPDVRTHANYFCMSNIMLTPIAKMGYRDDERLKKYIGLLLRSRQLDGGWHCYEDYAERSCLQDNQNALMLLGQFPEYQRDSSLKGAIDLLLEHWDRRGEGWRPDGFGTGQRFQALYYPAVKYTILRVLDSLSMFPYAVSSASFHSMLETVKRKARDGRYFAESTDSNYADFDFGQSREPSRWLTFLVNRIEKRAKELA